MTVECHSDGFDKLLIFNDLQANRERPKSSRILAKRLLAGQEEPAPKRGQSRRLSWKSFVTGRSQRERVGYRPACRTASPVSLLDGGKGGWNPRNAARQVPMLRFRDAGEGKRTTRPPPGGSSSRLAMTSSTRRTCHGSSTRREARGLQPLRLRIVAEHAGCRACRC